MTDPWAVTPREKIRFREHFQILRPVNGVVTGAQAGAFFMESKLGREDLSKIWALSDTDSDGMMNVNEFTIACKLISLKCKGIDVPKTLPPILLTTLLSAGGTPIMTPTGAGSLSPLETMKPIVAPQRPIIPPQNIQAAAVAPPIVPNLPQMAPMVYQPPMASVAPQPVVPQIDPTRFNAVTEIPTSVQSPLGQNGIKSRSMSITDRVPSIDSPSGASDWAINSTTRRNFTQIFNQHDRTRCGYLTGPQVKGVLFQYGAGLQNTTLAQIWTLSDIDADGNLGCEEFVLAMALCEMATRGEKLPKQLPPELVPPSFRKAISRPGSTVSSRHGSLSSQGLIGDVVDPMAGLPQTSFEDKRKENFEKGQAELERRRKALQDIQRKEQEERERKEREEAEKREKLRLEAELRRQQELERHYQRQKEIEMEMEENRKRQLEQKEAARKEMERQRQLEWEKQKIQEMEAQRQREQDNLLRLKGQNQNSSIELSTLNEKIKELSQKICETRSSVTNVKTVIDRMRTTRDTSNSEMTNLKAKIKEQNAKLVHLSQEKAKLDAKNKANPADQEQMFNNKQIQLQQLRDKVSETTEKIASKKNDIDANNEQLSEIKNQLTELIENCEEIYGMYDVQRNQVIELKNNRRNEAANASWGDDDASWGTTPAVQSTEPAPAAVAPVTAIPGYAQYRALYAFEGRNADEISFEPGDIIMVPYDQKAEPGWFAGEINGKTGWFPESYVEKLDDGGPAEIKEEEFKVDTYAVKTIEEPQTIEPASSYVKEEEDDVIGEYYEATYPYESAEPDDLTFGAGEMIFVTKKDGEWWTGSTNGRTGIFPCNYVSKPAQEQNIGRNGDMHTEVNNTPLKQENAESEAKYQAEMDSEVSQINTRPKSESVDYSVPASASATPSLRGKKPEIAQVIAPYESTTPEQLSLQRGQLIMIRKKTDTGWWEGELQAKGRRRQIGWFPATYVKVLQGGRNSGRNTPVSASKIELTETILDKVIALYPYKAQNDDELSFEKDDIISVVGRDEPEWWRGELNGVQGLFPSNYVGPFVTSGNV
uniref:Putative endocytic adaptor protein intersectin n=1 Tax=Nyssomyia neivai TaxID=330878 RepID=A0A1L8DMI3_9DIPT